MKKPSAPALVYGVTIVVVLLLVTWTLRPWEDGSASRLTASGLVPVLVLLIGQVSSWAVADGSARSARELRLVELGHDVDEAKRQETREDEAAARQSEAAALDSERSLFIGAVRASSILSTDIALVAHGPLGAQVDPRKYADARVLFLQMLQRMQARPTIRARVHAVLEAMDTFVNSTGFDTQRDSARELLVALLDLERDMGTEGLLR
jgi:hypothetical protein